MKRGEFLLSKFEEIICSGIVVIMMGVLFIGVIFRYILQNPLLWTDELSRLSLIWLTFIGIAVGVKEESHACVNFFEQRLPLTNQRILRVARKGTFLIFAALMIIYGTKLLKLKMFIPTPALRWPWGLFYLPCIVSGGLIIIHILLDLWKIIIQGKDEI